MKALVWDLLSGRLLGSNLDHTPECDSVRLHRPPGQGVLALCYSLRNPHHVFLEKPQTLLLKTPVLVDV